MVLGKEPGPGPCSAVAELALIYTQAPDFFSTEPMGAIICCGNC